MSAKLKVGVLISGRGSNLKALIDACSAPDFPARIVIVISNVANAGGLAYASEAAIPFKIVPHKEFTSREGFDAAVDAELRRAGVELVCEAGFMRIHSDGFVRNWLGKIINIHPSLLPAFKGTHVHEQVIASGVKVSGCTVHYVTPELDSGPIIAQSEVPVMEGDTPDSLAARVLLAEHELYPMVLKRIAEGRVRLENGRVVSDLSPRSRDR